MNSRYGSMMSSLGCLTLVAGIILTVIYLYLGQYSAAFAMLAVFILLTAIFFGLMSSIAKRKKAKQIQYLQTIQPSFPFQETHSFISSDVWTKIAIDEEKEKICIWQAHTDEQYINTQTPYQIYEYTFNDILACEMSENDVSIGTVARESEKAKTFLNGLFTEEDGSIIGGQNTTTQPKNSTEVNSLELKIIVNDFSKPYHVIRFYKYDPDVGMAKIDPKHPTYDEYINTMRKWYMRMNYIIKSGSLDEMDESKDDNLARGLDVETYVGDVEILETADPAFTQSQVMETDVGDKEMVDPSDQRKREVDFTETSLYQFEQLLAKETKESAGDLLEQNEEEAKEQASKEDESPLSDFEKFLEENRRKQHRN